MASSRGKVSSNHICPIISDHSNRLSLNRNSSGLWKSSFVLKTSEIASCHAPFLGKLLLWFALRFSLHIHPVRQLCAKSLVNPGIPGKSGNPGFANSQGYQGITRLPDFLVNQTYPGNPGTSGNPGAINNQGYQGLTRL